MIIENKTVKMKPTMRSKARTFKIILKFCSSSFVYAIFFPHNNLLLYAIEKKALKANHMSMYFCCVSVLCNLVSSLI